MLKPIKLTMIEPVEGWTDVLPAYVVDKHTVVTLDASKNEFIFRQFKALTIMPGQPSLKVRIGSDIYKVFDLPAPPGVDISKLDEVTVADFMKKYFEKGRF